MNGQKIIIDTSIWIEYFKNNKKYVPTIETNLSLENILITGPIISELLHGVKGLREYDMPGCPGPSDQKTTTVSGNGRVHNTWFPGTSQFPGISSPPEEPVLPLSPQC